MDSIIIIIIAAYMLTMVGTGIYAAGRNKKTSDYLVAGRKLGVGMTAITLAAVQIGVGIVLSSATNGYNGGIWPGIYYALGCGGGLIVAGLFTARKLRAQEGYVPIDYFAKRYHGDSKPVRFWASLSNIPSLLGIFIAQMLASGGILSGFGLPFRWGVILCTGVVLIYCTIGGLWGVVLTDVIQFGVIVVGIPIFFIVMLVQFIQGGGNVGEAFSTPFIPGGMWTRFVYLVVPFLISIAMSYDAYTRVQSAKDAETAKKGCLIGGVFVIIVGFMCSAIGVFARQKFPGVTDGIFTIAAKGSLPPVFAGIVLAAILSAAMSSANCVILSLGSCVARDFYNRFLHPEIDNLDELPHSKLVSQITVFVGSLLGIWVAFYMTDILDAMIIFNYPYMGSLVIPLLGGLLWKGATRLGAFAAAIAGGIVGVISFFIGIPSPIQGIINLDLALLTAYLVSAIVLVVVSLFDKAGQEANRLQKI